MGDHSVTFANPLYLQLGAGLVLLVVVGLWSHMRRRRKLAAFLGGARAASRLSGTSLYRPRLERALLLSGAAVAVALAAAGPVLPDREPPPPPAPPVREVVFAIDVSASMQAADERPTRLGRAAAIVAELLPSLEDDRVGLVLFSGTAYPIAPPTHDREAFRYFLSGVVPTLASAWDPGSRPSVGIAEASRYLQDRPDSVTARMIVLLSDGEAGESTDAVRAAAAAAAAAGITVHSIGVGTSRGSGMTLSTGPYQLGGPVVTEDGTPVVSRFREGPLRELAAAGSGTFVVGSDEVGLAAFRTNLMRPAVPAIAVRPRTVLERYDPAVLFAALAILLLLAESILDVRLPGTGIATARSLARRSI